MSGGSIGDYGYFKLNDIIEDIQDAIDDNNQGYSIETIEKFQEGIELMEKAIIYAHRIDWLVSGDDSEETFHKRLEDEIQKTKRVSGRTEE